MNVLCACEESQRVCIAFRERGHRAFSCDIQECSGGYPEWHIKGDALSLIYPDVWIHSMELDGTKEMFGTFVTQDGTVHQLPNVWDLLIAFPPCTYISNAGACRLYPKKGQLDMERYAKGLEAKEFFMKFYNANCSKIVIENPVSSKVFNMPTHTQEIQPYQFDTENEHPYTKKTRLWIKGLRPLIPTTPDRKPIGPYIPSLTSRKDSTKYGAAKRGKDAKNRSKTFIGIAKAMAEQWG